MTKYEAKKASNILKNKLDYLKTVTQWAEYMGYDRSVFTRKYRCATGKSPREVLRELRIEKVKILLKTDLKYMYEVADNVGLSSDKSLYSFCKKEMDISPSELKECLRMKNRRS